MEPTHCNFAGGKCEFNNPLACPTKPVLTHCHVLREKYRKEKENGDDCNVRKAV